MIISNIIKSKRQKIIIFNETPVILLNLELDGVIQCALFSAQMLK